MGGFFLQKITDIYFDQNAYSLRQRGPGWNCSKPRIKQVLGVAWPVGLGFAQLRGYKRPLPGYQETHFGPHWGFYSSSVEQPGEKKQSQKKQSHPTQPLEAPNFILAGIPRSHLS